jgi:outer membrane receptor protein involved in Fe transport
MTNLPRGEGRGGATWTWRTLTAGANIEVVGSRPRSVTGGTLDRFATLGLSLAWKPVRRLEIRLAGDNLNGATVERWAGYPEPKRIVTLGVVASF